MGRVLVGTSGYVYREWRGILYPPKLAAKRWLPHYARFFPTLELNNTFYRLPSIEAVDGWRQQTPDDFVFVAKGSRFLTHMKRLLDVDQGPRRFFERVDHLRHKLAVVLWQLPPQMKNPDLLRLDRFLTQLPRHVRHAVEFRDPAWYTDEVCDLLDSHGAAFVEHDLVRIDPPRATGGFRYLRFHGATGKYQGRYGGRRLAPIAGSLRRWKRKGDVFVFFNNDRFGHAVYDAFAMRELVEGRDATDEAEIPVDALRL